AFHSYEVHQHGHRKAHPCFVERAHVAVLVYVLSPGQHQSLDLELGMHPQGGVFATPPFQLAAELSGLIETLDEVATAECFNLSIAQWRGIGRESREQMVQHVRAIFHSALQLAAEFVAVRLDMCIESRVVGAFWIENEIVAAIETRSVRAGT